MKAKHVDYKFFILGNFAVSLLISAFCFKYANFGPGEIFFTGISLISNTIMLSAIWLVLSLPFFFARAGRYFVFVLYSFFQFLLVLDAILYHLFKFHINSMVLNLVFTKGGLQAIDEGWGMKLTAVGIFLTVFLTEWLLIKFSLSSKTERKFRVNYKFLTAAALFFVVVDKAAYAWSDLKQIPFISRNSVHLFLYQPFTMRHFAEKYLKIKPRTEMKVKIDKKRSLLNYPLKKISVSPNGNLPNILIILIDSFRYDMMNPEVAVNIYEFSKKSQVFLNHYSGGNCSRFGVFSLFYGIYGNYWFPVLKEGRSPVIMDVLASLGYEFKIFAAARLTYPEFDRTCFVNVPRKDIYDEPPTDIKHEKDEKTALKLIEYLKGRKGEKPFFGFIFFDGPHGSYDYPPEFEKFKPAHFISYLAQTKEEIVPVFNKYKNAVYYNDYLVGKILDALKNEANNTLVFISGDHGEAFFEKGYRGHNHGYCEEEVRVPLIVYVPWKRHRVYRKFTNHMDIVPTLLGVLNVKNEPSDYSNGYDLFKNYEKSFEPVFSWDTAGIVKRDITLRIPLSSHRLVRIKAYRTDDYSEITSRQIVKDNIKFLLEFQKEAGRFYK